MDTVIKRDFYLNQLIDKKENGLIKVITGIRRCGKSYLLFNLFYDYLLASGVKEEQIITVALDDDTFVQYRDPDMLSQYLRSKIVNKEQYYILIDEVQYAITKDELKNPENIRLYNVLNGLMRLRGTVVPEILRSPKFKGYRYPHDYENDYLRQEYLPEDLRGRKYYEFGTNKTEQAAKAYWDNVKSKPDRKKSPGK